MENFVVGDCQRFCSYGRFAEKVDHIEHRGKSGLDALHDDALFYREKSIWVANKGFEISKFEFKFWRA